MDTAIYAAFGITPARRRRNNHRRKDSARRRTDFYADAHTHAHPDGSPRTCAPHWSCPSDDVFNDALRNAKARKPFTGFHGDNSDERISVAKSRVARQ